jgi:hypothetical protein
MAERSDRPRWNFQAVIAIVGQFNGGFEMKTLAAIITALALTSVPAVAQMTGAPGAAQSDPAKPGMGNPDQSAMKKEQTTGMMKSKASKKNMMPKEDVTKNSMSK